MSLRYCKDESLELNIVIIRLYIESGRKGIAKAPKAAIGINSFLSLKKIKVIIAAANETQAEREPVFNKITVVTKKAPVKKIFLIIDSVFKKETRKNGIVRTKSSP